MSTGVKVLLVAAVMGAVLYYYYVSSTPVPTNAPGAAGSAGATSLDNPNATSGTTLGMAAATSGVAMAPDTSGSVASLGLKLPSIRVTTPTATPSPVTYVTNLLKRVPKLGGTDALSAGTNGSVLAAPSGARAAFFGTPAPTGAGAAGTSSTGYQAAPTPTKPLLKLGNALKVPLKV